MKTNVVFLFLAITVILNSCGKIDNSKDELVLYNTLDMENRVLNFETTKREGNAHGGKYYSTIDSVNKFAVGYSYIIPDSLKSKNLTVYVSAWLRENEAPLEGGIVIALSNSKGIVAWRESNPPKNVPYKANDWILFKDSITYSSSMFKDTFVEVGVVGIKTYGKDQFDIDDFQVKYKFSK